MNLTASEVMKRAFRRVAILIGMLTLISAAFYFVDEFVFAHDEIDGYIPRLLLLRLILAILISGVFLALVYPLSHVVVEGAMIVFSRKNPQALNENDVETRVLYRKSLSWLLCGLALTASYFLLRDPIERAFLPLSGFGWTGAAFFYLFTILLMAASAMFAFRVWQLMTILQSRSKSAAGGPMPATMPQSMAGAVYCASCGSLNPQASGFCRNCGERMGS